MTPTLTALLLGVALSSAVSGMAKETCEEFGRGVTFTPGQAVGIWYPVRLEQSIRTDDSQCIQFTAVAEQERKDQASKIGKMVDVKWEKVSLKLQIPCVGPSGRHNKTADYYLEDLDVPGSYRTLQMPPPTAKLEPASFERQHMRLKMFLNKYLAMMDCHLKFVFIMSKLPHVDRIEPELMKILQENMSNDE